MRAPSKTNTGKPDNPARVRVNLNPLLSLARSEGFEPPAYRFEERLVVSELSISLEAKRSPVSIEYFAISMVYPVKSIIWYRAMR